MELALGILVVVLLFSWYKSNKVAKEFQKERNSYREEIQNQYHLITTVQVECSTAKATVLECSREIDNLRRQLNEANKELNFYKNIEKDSRGLNVQTPDEDRQYMLEQVATQVLNAKAGDSRELINLDSVEQGENNSLDDEQLLACHEMGKSSDNFFITGKAGTGKSFLLDVFRKTTDKSHIVLAPTGIAALNVNGATLHSTFGYDNLVQLDVDRISESTIRLKSEKKLLLKTVSTIIIDEISMVRADTFDKIDRILKVINRNNLPFGGKQVLLFGDLFQLPPVTKPKEYDYLMDRYGGIYFFCSDAYKNGGFKFMELTINHRQKEDAEFFSLLNRIRDGSTTQDDIDILNSRVVQDISVFDRFTTLLPTKAEVERLNQRHIDQLNSTGFTYSARVALDKYPNKNRNLEAVFPIATSLYLKKGALVMMVANDSEHKWVNGTLGIVSDLSNESISVAINGRVYTIPPMDFTEQEITYANGKIAYEDVLKVVQYPVVPAYAMTIHKSQGQTYQNIVCDIDRCFASGQAYVALSRCASLNGLHLKRRVSGASILVDKTVSDFYHSNLMGN